MNLMATPAVDNPAEEHLTALRDSVADFTARGTTLKRVRELRDKAPGFDRKVWGTMAELGWLGILVPEADGGLGLGIAEAAAVAEGLAPSLVPEPFVAACVLATRAILQGDNAQLQKRLLPDIVAGVILPALAWQESADHADALAVKTTAKAVDGAVTLTGSKHFVAGAAAADGFVVSAKGADGLALYWVPQQSAGLKISLVALADGTFGATLNLDGVRVAADQRVASPAAASGALTRAIDDATIVASAELLGISGKVLDITLEYLRTRKQFGKPIGSFQALQHRATDLFIQKQLAAAVLQQVLAEYDSAQSPQARTAAASRLKARCGEAALLITRQAVQMHGAMGFTDECDVGLYLKRVMVLSAWLGNEQQQRRRFAHAAPLDASATDMPRAGAVAPAHVKDLPRDTDWNALDDGDFRLMLRAFVEQNYPDDLRYLPRRVHWKEVRDWNLKLAEKGWIAPAWPRERGGMGLSPAKLLIFMDEFERWGVGRAPDQGITQVGPVIMQHGTEAQKQHYLPKILACEYIWCQGYSEPNAGSDLASLSTQAVLDGDAFVINGQKIWTSMAMDATHIYVLCRTDKTAKKQEGISFIIVDLRNTPGITIRPIRNIAGHEEFCEVFFDNVRAPRANLVGALNNGWTIAKALLGFERLTIGTPRRPQIAFKQLQVLARRLGLFEDSGFVDRFTRVRLDLADHATLYAHYADQARRGVTLGPDVSILKIWAMEAFQRVTELALEAAGAYGAQAGVIDLDGERVDLLAPFYMSRPGTIYGGSNEIQRNIVAKYVLKLPS